MYRTKKSSTGNIVDNNNFIFVLLLGKINQLTDDKKASASTGFNDTFPP
jgi:hypothetical protein